jgi:hypothetical protein
MKMSYYDEQRARQDARNGKAAADMKNAHWKAKQDHDAAFADEKAKNNR